MKYHLDKDNSIYRNLPTWLFIVLAGLFLAISYSNNHYWDEYYYLYSVHSFSLNQLLQMELDLSQGLFPQGFFSAKYGFVTFLYLLENVFSYVPNSLYLIQFVFALLVLFFTWVSFLLLKEIFDTRTAQYSAVVLLFLPLSLYFSYKVLSELFSLSWIILGSWTFLAGLSNSSKKKTFFYFAFSILFLLIGVICRFTSLFFYGAMLTAIFLVGDQKYPRKKLFCSSIIVLFCLAVLSFVCFKLLIGLTLADINGLLESVTVRTHGIAIKIYSSFMTIQFFFIALLAAAVGIRYKSILLVFLWAAICAAPFLLLSDYLEPRYFYMTSVPMAVLAYHGLSELSVWAHSKWKINARGMFFLFLVLIVLGNRLIFADLMPYELVQNRYKELIESIEARSPSPTFLVPWISDFCLLKYAYPDKKIHLAWSAVKEESNEFYQNETFVKWAGGLDYIGRDYKIFILDRPIYYVGWKYNQPAVKIKKKMMWLKSGYVDSIEVNEGLKNHLAQSWIWFDSNLKLMPALTIEPYEAFLVNGNE